MVIFVTCYLFISQDLFQERSRMSSAHEANTQRLMSALRDKETALKVRTLETKLDNITKWFCCCRTKFFNSILLIWHNFRPILSANESLSQAAQHKVKTARHSQTYAYHKLTCVDFFLDPNHFFSWIPHDAGRLSNNLVVKL